MPVSDAPGLVAGAILLGAVHGAEPGHGWPIAAAYAFERANKWAAGLLAGLVIGVGHLISSLAVVGVFFALKSALDLAGATEPLTVWGVRVGSPVGVVAGILLVALGIREYRRGHEHDHDHGHGRAESHDHEHPHTSETDGAEGHTHDHGSRSVAGLRERLKAALPGVENHDHPDLSAARSEGLPALASSAFLLGFAHEEEIELIGICAGSDLCLPLMTIYALTVIVAIVTLTLALVAGYERFEDRMERLADYFPAISAVVLVGMGLGFIAGVF